MATRDHEDLGSSLCTIGGVGRAHYFHTKQPEPDELRHERDDQDNPDISWPNYHSGANGDFQTIAITEPPHVLLSDPDAADGLIRYLPAHPHEGAVGVPEGDTSARVIATGVSQASGNRFNLAVAFEPSSNGGPELAESTFHHFADYNWDPSSGCPSFVSEKPADGLKRRPEAMADTHRYALNVAGWLSGALRIMPHMAMDRSELA